PSKLAQIYTEADVFVNPSREETFGLTVAEAMACGTWPIVYADTACAEVVEKGTGTIVTGDFAELEKAIRECRENDICERTEEAATFFSKQRFGQEVLAVYEEKR
ncbi:glycosyltransferase, partial [Waltera sp.]